MKLWCDKHHTWPIFFRALRLIWLAMAMQFVVMLYLAKPPEISLIASYRNILNHYAWFQKLIASQLWKLYNYWPELRVKWYRLQFFTIVQLHFKIMFILFLHFWNKIERYLHCKIVPEHFRVGASCLLIQDKGDLVRWFLWLSCP